MPIITLTSDWGLRDYYIGAVKGTILRQLPEATIIDISHLVSPFDLKQASFIVGNAYHYFPEGTVHILSLDSIESISRPHVALKAEGHYFVGADNGIFSLFLQQPPEIIVGLNIMQDTGYFTFPTRDRFVKAACHLASGHAIEELGDILPGLMQKYLYQPMVNDSEIKGKAIQIDAYGNIFTNISQKLFLNTALKRKFSLIVKRPSYMINKIRNAYDEVPEGEMLALFASNGYLQIAINRGRASSLLGVEVDDDIMVSFED